MAQGCRLSAARVGENRTARLCACPPKIAYKITCKSILLRRSYLVQDIVWSAAGLCGGGGNAASAGLAGGCCRGDYLRITGRLYQGTSSPWSDHVSVRMRVVPWHSTA